MGGPDFEVVAAHPKAAALEPCVVAFVLLGDEVGDDLPLVVNLADVDVLGHRSVGFDRPDAINA